jgi:GNAT superfamily N-acetyltransferase
MVDADVRICRLSEMPDAGSVVAQITAIFFEASATRTFESAAARAAFRERWLGRYLAHFPDEAFIACGADGRVAGYLVGCLEDPARNEHFADISYFADFAGLTRRFPAHLHVNLRPEFRGRGIGAELIESFAAHAAAAGAPGMHVVTGEGMRNTAFYRRCGFEPVAWAEWNGRRLAFLGRRLAQD